MTSKILTILAAVVVLAGGAAAFAFFSGGSAAPSGETVAPELETTDDGTEQGSEAADADVYAIVTADSEVGFEIEEELRGDQTTAAGTTSEVAGQFRLVAEDPSATEVGEIVVNARTLETGQSLRDRAVRGGILGTDEFEFIRFTPTELSELPDTLPEGEAFDFQITGDLTVRDTTAPATFALSATPEGDGWRITGDATVQRSTYELTIPSVPNVANVADDVTLTLDLLVEPGTA